MNAAARLLNQSMLREHWLTLLFIDKSKVNTMMIFLFLLMSAFSVIYATNTSRMLCSNLRQIELNRHHLKEHYEQLMLERSTWSSQARIQHLATSKLEMVVPSVKSFIYN